MLKKDLIKIFTKNRTITIIKTTFVILLGMGMFQNLFAQELDLNSPNSKDSKESKEKNIRKNVDKTDKSTTSYPNPWYANSYKHGLFPKQTKVKNSFFSDVLIDYSLDMFLENVYDFSVYQMPAMGDYSYPDNYVFSLLGNSWLWNRYYYNGLNINDPFFSGKTFHKMPMVGKDLEIDAIAGSLFFNSLLDNQITYTKINTGYLGDHIPFYKIFKDSYSQQAPQLRERPPSNKRRRTPLALDFYKRIFLTLDDSRLWLDSYLSVRSRRLNDFDEEGNLSSYGEEFLQMTFGGEWEDNNGNRPFGFLTTFLTRNQLYGEFNYHQSETSTLHDFVTSIYYKSNWDRLLHGHILHFNYKSIVKNHEGFSRNLYDITGEGLDPFYPSENIYSISQHSYFGYNFDFHKEKFMLIKADFNNSINILDPNKKNYSNPVYFKSPSKQFSLYVTDWKSEFFSYALLDNELYINFNKGAKEGFSIDGKIGMDLNGLILSKENLLRVRPNFDLGMNFINGVFRSVHHKLRLEIGSVNIPFDSELALFLSDSYETGKRYVWNDTDNDLNVDEGEKSDELHSTTGGGYRSVDKNLNQPHYYYIDIPYNVDFDKNWSLGLSAHYRIFKEQLWVKYKDVNQAGSFKDIDGVNVFIPNLGEKNYEVYNLPATKFPAGRNWFNDSPIYAGLTLKVSGIGARYFFKTSFSAYLINGVTTLGNGPLHNSQGTLSELMADPNANTLNIGRLDADRGYLGKMLFAFRILPQFVWTSSVKYRDGQPFGRWNVYTDEANKQVAFLRESVSGDNILLYNGDFGTREDALWTVNTSLKYTFMIKRKPLDLSLSIYNIIDIGRELMEFVLDQQGSIRNALELQVPRGLTLALEYSY